MKINKVNEIAMIAEDYVSFDTAKLLKEKGFDEGCNSYFISDNEIALISVRRDFNDYGVYLSAPTLQMAMKWLREVHKLYVNVCPCVEGYYWTEKWHSYVDNLEKRYPFGKFIGTFNSAEESCEASIKYCLENLIK